MARFNYKMRFSPYANSIKAKSYKEAWEILKRIYPEYENIKDVVQYINRE